MNLENINYFCNRNKYLLKINISEKWDLKDHKVYFMEQLIQTV
jgi:hypothetical protein